MATSPTVDGATLHELLLPLLDRHTSQRLLSEFMGETQRFPEPAKIVHACLRTGANRLFRPNSYASDDQRDVVAIGVWGLLARDGRAVMNDAAALLAAEHVFGMRCGNADHSYSVNPDSLMSAFRRVSGQHDIATAGPVFLTSVLATQRALIDHIRASRGSDELLLGGPCLAYYLKEDIIPHDPSLEQEASGIVVDRVGGQRIKFTFD